MKTSNEGSEHPVSAGASVGKHGDGMRQFIIERACPIDFGNWYQPPDGLLPLVIWVDLSQPDDPPSHEKCRERRYHVPLEQAMPIRNAIGLPSPSWAYTVCAHMGHLIE